MKTNRRAFLGLAAAAVAHQATKGLSGEVQPIPEDVEDGPFYVATIHPFVLAELMADKTIGATMRQLMGEEAI